MKGKPRCGKKRFDRIGAMLALAKAQNARSINRLESREYECQICGLGIYHLTSEGVSGSPGALSSDSAR